LVVSNFDVEINTKNISVIHGFLFSLSFGQGDFALKVKPHYDHAVFKK